MTKVNIIRQVSSNYIRGEEMLQKERNNYFCFLWARKTPARSTSLFTSSVPPLAPSKAMVTPMIHCHALQNTSMYNISLQQNSIFKLKMHEWKQGVNGYLCPICEIPQYSSFLKWWRVCIFLSEILIHVKHQTSYKGKQLVPYSAKQNPLQMVIYFNLSIDKSLIILLKTHMED